MIAYRVGTNYFFSIYLALYESMKFKKSVEFICNDDEYEKHNWTEEPTHSLDDLMIAHAHNLRSKYERIILGWSGGTDSHTIYRIFKKNNIHIDEIIVKASPHLEQYPEQHFTWINKNHYDKHTIITRYDQNDSFLKTIDCPDDDWIFKNRGDLLMFGMSTGANGVKHIIERNHAGKNWIYVAGFEKPRLIYKKGRWRARQLDNPLRQTMGYTHINHFFLEPLIHIKQSHMMKRAVKEQMKKNNLPLYENDWAESKWPCQTRTGYREWAIACGRDLELTEGASHLQKVRSDQYKTITVDGKNMKSFLDNNINPDPTHRGYLDKGDQAAVNFLKGLYNLNDEKKFINFLNENNHLRKKDHLLDPSFIWSKEFDLGE
tara:strand:+ start:2985 stop:4109 length:1125 start_codon:yes stop_codon:yes gene_type:complete